MTFQKFAYWLVRICFLPFFRLKVAGFENIPEGAALICSNHTALRDPIFVILAMKSKNFPVSMAKAELFKFRPFGWLLKKVDTFPINRGRSDVGAIKFALSALKSGRKLLMFPEGTRVRDGENGDAKTGAGMLALRSDAPVVPVFVSRRKRIFGTCKVVFGPLFYPLCDHKPSSDDYKRVAEDIMDRITALEPNGPHALQDLRI